MFLYFETAKIELAMAVTLCLAARQCKDPEGPAWWETWPKRRQLDPQFLSSDVMENWQLQTLLHMKWIPSKRANEFHISGNILNL